MITTTVAAPFVASKAMLAGNMLCVLIPVFVFLLIREHFRNKGE